MFVGAGFALGLLSILSIGIFVLVLTASGMAFLATRRTSSIGLPGLISGLSLPLFYVAYLNRQGPGTICEYSRGGTNCAERWSPWPWAAAGGVFLLAGVVLFVVIYLGVKRRRTVRTASSA